MSAQRPLITGYFAEYVRYITTISLTTELPNTEP